MGARGRESASGYNKNKRDESWENIATDRRRTGGTKSRAPGERRETFTVDRKRAPNASIRSRTPRRESVCARRTRAVPRRGAPRCIPPLAPAKSPSCARTGRAARRRRYFPAKNICAVPMDTGLGIDGVRNDGCVNPCVFAYVGGVCMCACVFAYVGCVCMCACVFARCVKCLSVHTILYCPLS